MIYMVLRPRSYSFVLCLLFKLVDVEFQEARLA